MTSRIEALPEEVLTIIAEQCLQKRADLCTLSLVSKRMAKITKPVLYRYVDLNVQNQSLGLHPTSMFNRKHPGLPHIRHLDVFSDDLSPHAERTKVLKLLRNCPPDKLRSFAAMELDWKVFKLLNSSQKNLETIDLGRVAFTRWPLPFDYNMASRICTWSKLHTLHIRDLNGILDLQIYSSMIDNAPKLQNLYVDTDFVDNDEDESNWEFFHTLFQDINDSGKKLRLKLLHIQNLDLCLNLAPLVKGVDLTLLRDLKLTFVDNYGDALAVIGQIFRESGSSLRSFKIEQPHIGREDLDYFLMSFSGLQRLKIEGRLSFDLLDTIVLRSHQETLEELDIKPLENCKIHGLEEVSCKMTIIRFVRTCPRLKSARIVVPREGSMAHLAQRGVNPPMRGGQVPYSKATAEYDEFLEMLVSMPNLEKITIHNWPELPGAFDKCPKSRGGAMSKETSMRYTNAYLARVNDMVTSLLGLMDDHSLNRKLPTFLFGDFGEACDGKNHRRLGPHRFVPSTRFDFFG